MIDEELYQQASEELASERRDLRVWARACSLAPEDHDEARYLYTNLRVEELLAERDGRGNGDAPQSAPSIASAPGPALATGAVAVPGTPMATIGPTWMRTATSTPCSPRSRTRTRTRTRTTPTPNRVRPRCLRPGRARPSVTAWSERMPSGASSVRTPRPSHDDDDLDDFDWLEQERGAPGARIDGDAARTAPAPERADDETNALELELELERQARELRIEPDEAVPRPLAPARAPTPPTPLFAEPARPRTSERTRPTLAPEEPSEERMEAFVTGPLELDTGRGGEYAVYRRDGSREQAVKRGGSIGALLLTVPWLLYHHLFGTTLLYLLFATARARRADDDGTGMARCGRSHPGADEGRDRGLHAAGAVRPVRRAVASGKPLAAGEARATRLLARGPRTRAGRENGPRCRGARRETPPRHGPHQRPLSSRRHFFAPRIACGPAFSASAPHDSRGGRRYLMQVIAQEWRACRHGRTARRSRLRAAAAGVGRGQRSPAHDWATARTAFPPARAARSSAPCPSRSSAARR